ncbi:hypothetical protein LCGC14_2567260, partial [marine sediment metagenome]
LLCTTKASNEKQNHILPKHGWERLKVTLNRRTDNLIYMWTKNLEQV